MTMPHEDHHGHAHPHHESDAPSAAHAEGIWHRLSSMLFGHSHDHAESIDAALEGSKRGIRAVKISLVALAATALFQFVVVAASGSVALLADSIHNLADALTAVPLWI